MNTNVHQSPMSDKPAVPVSTKNTPYEVEVTAPSLTGVRIINPTLYRDPNNPDALSFTPFPAASPVAGVSQQKNYHFSDEQVMDALVGTDYLREHVRLMLVGRTSGEKWSLYRAIVKLAQPEGDGWIAVTPETMPEVNDEVWAWLKFGEGLKVGEREYADTSWLQKDGTWALGSAKDFTVTHWRPLPSPPAGESR